MKFSGLTKKGRLYLAKIQAAEEPIQFTKIKFGDAKLSEHENPADLVDIKNIKVEKSILNKEQKEDAVILTTIIDNVGLVEGYFPRETGIYVQDEDQEVLYFYMNDGDETSWLPPEVDGPHRMEMKINLISSNTGSVLVHNDGKDLYITKDYLESNYTQKGNFNGTAQDIEDRVVAAVGKEDGKFPLTESVAGNIYYFPGNKKFYYCLKSQTSRVSVPNADFEELSIYQNRKKLENFIKVKNNKIFTIGNICIETITCTPNIAGVRTVKIESDFKNIFSIFLTGYITEGQNAEHLMRQVVHDYYSKIVATKQVRLYTAGNQSIELTIIGTI